MTLTTNWPPDYVAILAWRQEQLRRLRSDPKLIHGAREFYRSRPCEFIDHWVDTYDPRNAGGELPARLPFRLFPKQRELVEFIVGCLEAESSGLIEKARDMGATWVCTSLSVWLWLFWPGSAVGWGSRKEQLVDKLGDPDSIFQKMRMIILGLPRDVFWPVGFNPKDHMGYMKFINPETGATITGEAGDNIGRGGRKRIYFKDESAHYERPELIEAALADNTRVQIDISSVNGIGNVFHRRRESGIDWAPGQPVAKGKTNVFVMDWRDHPAKTQAWYDERKSKAQDDGLLHVFAQEVDRNYAAAIDGIVIPGDWVKAAIDAHTRLGFDDTGGWVGALDVADSGGDTNAYVKRKGSVLKWAAEWGARDTGVTARKAIEESERHKSLPMDLQYDCIGVGTGVKAETNRLADEGLLPKGVRLIPWDAGAAVKDPDKRVVPGDRDSPLNKDFFQNFKAQGWWHLRGRFERTYRAVTEGVKFDPDEMISLDSTMPLLRKIEKELSQPTASKSARMRLVIDKTPEGTKSPNLGDAVMMAFFPADSGPLPLELWV